MIRRASTKGVVVVRDSKEEKEKDKDKGKDKDKEEEEEEEPNNPLIFQWDGLDLGSLKELEPEQPLAAEVSPPGMHSVRLQPRLIAF
jgi:hypothetical protein